MKRICSLLILMLIAFSGLQSQNLPFAIAHTYKAGAFDSSATGYISFDHTVQQLYSVNQQANGFEIIDYSDIYKPNVLQTVDVSGFISKIRCIESASGFVFVAGDGSSAQLPGKLLIYTSNGVYRKQLSLGVTPDRMKFSHDDISLIIANEGIPDANYSTDPPGTVNIINTAAGVNFITQADVKTVDFTRLDTTNYDPLIHIYSNAGQNPSEDVEPEAIAFSSDNQTAYIVLQENNAVAVVDIPSAKIDTVLGLGYRDYGMKGLDASDQANSIMIDTYQGLYGIHQPSDIESFSHAGSDFTFSVNQGAPREYSGFNESVRVKNQPVDPSKFTNLSHLLQDTVLGRLFITSVFGDHNGDFLHDSLLSFGSRSVSIWDSSGTEIWNSGDQIAQLLASTHAVNFNSSANSNNSYKLQSDNMGAEPSAVAIGEVDGNRYAFVSLYQMGGILVYDISDPYNPQFELFELNRDFNLPANDPMAGDLGPIDLEFVPASRTNLNIALLFVANQVSGTINVYQTGIGVGIDEFESSPGHSVFPNPSEGVFYFGSRSDFEVFNINGQLIEYCQNCDQIDLSGQVPGFYVIKQADGVSIKVVKR